MPDWLRHKGDLDRIPMCNQSGGLGIASVRAEGDTKWTLSEAATNDRMQTTHVAVGKNAAYSTYASK